MASITRRTAPSGRAARRDELRARLLEAIEELLAAGETISELPVERVASAAGVSRSTFYVYFEDKGELLRAWFEEIQASLDEAVLGWWSVDATCTRDDVRAALAHVVRTYRPHAALMAAMYDSSVSDPSIRELVDAMLESSSRGLAKHIRKGQADGFVDAGMPRREVARWLTLMAERGLHRMVAGADDAEVEALIDGYTTIVWNTLYAPMR